MAIGMNLVGNFGTRFAPNGGAAASAPPPPAPPSAPPAASPPPAPQAAPPVLAAPPPPAPPGTPPAVAMPGTGLVRPFPILPISVPPVPILVPPPQPAATPATTLARGAIALLSGLDGAIVHEALNAITNQRLTADTLMDYLERKVRIGEVLANRAAQWSATTRTDFAGESGAFQMPADRTDTMDAIVSLAILNDRNLEAEIRAENTHPTTPTDLLQSRKVVWQWPAAGTVLAPPYIVLIAVEQQETATADTIVSSINDQLGVFQGFKLPQAALQKL